MFSIGISPCAAEGKTLDPFTAAILAALEAFIPQELDRELAKVRAGDWRFQFFSQPRLLRLELLQACRPETPFQEILREVWQAWLARGLPAATLPCSSSLAEARQRLAPWALDYLLHHTVKLAQQCEPLSAWPGHRILTLDAAMLPLCRTPALVKHFGATHTQHGEAYYPQALSVWLVSARMSAVLAHCLAPCRHGEERYAPFLLRDSLRPGDLVLGDGRIGTYPSLAQVVAREAYCLFRSPGPLAIAKHLTQRYAPDDSDLCLPCTTYTQQAYPNLRLPPQLHLRAVNFSVPNPDGGREWVRADFLTNLPRALFPVWNLARLGRLRWSHETVNNDLKSRLGLGAIRSQTVAGVEREVLAHLCVHNCLRVLLAQTQHDAGLATGFTAVRSALYQTNQQLRLAPDRPAELWSAFAEMLRQPPCVYRPGRSEPRLARPSRRRHRIFKYSRAQWRENRKARSDGLDSRLSKPAGAP
jgi:hypothetical protein